MNRGTDTIGTYLDILELDRIPDRDGLQKAFNRLIKKYHPDLNPQRREWAHEQTRLLLEASGFLKQHIREGVSWPEISDPEPEEKLSDSYYANPFYAKKKVGGSDAILLQLIGDEKGKWAFFLKSIDKIVEFEASRKKRYLEGIFYNLNGLFYPYHALFAAETEEQETIGAIVLYGKETDRIAFHVPSIRSFGDIVSVNKKEIIFRKDENGRPLDASVYHDLSCYRFPGTLVSEAFGL